MRNSPARLSTPQGGDVAGAFAPPFSRPGSKNQLPSNKQPNSADTLQSTAGCEIRRQDPESCSNSPQGLTPGPRELAQIHLRRIDMKIDCLSGPFELRRPRFPGEGGALCVEDAACQVEIALRETVAINGGALWDLLDELGMLSPHLLTTPERIVSSVMESLSCERLIVAREGTHPGDVVADRLWEAYDTFVASLGREFMANMRAHRLVSRDQAGELRRAADFDVVPAAEARDLVARATKVTRTNLSAAQVQLLTDHIIDLHAPLGQSGFVLLRAPLPQAARSRLAQEVVTPEKLKQMAAKDWTEISLVDQDGNPLAGTFDLALPGGEKRRVTVAEDGFVRLDV